MSSGLQSEFQTSQGHTENSHSTKAYVTDKLFLNFLSLLVTVAGDSHLAPG